MSKVCSGLTKQTSPVRAYTKIMGGPKLEAVRMVSMVMPAPLLAPGLVMEMIKSDYLRKNSDCARWPLDLRLVAIGV